MPRVQGPRRKKRPAEIVAPIACNASSAAFSSTQLIIKKMDEVIMQLMTPLTTDGKAMTDARLVERSRIAHGFIAT